MLSHRLLNCVTFHCSLSALKRFVRHWLTFGPAGWDEATVGKCCSVSPASPCLSADCPWSLTWVVLCCFSQVSNVLLAVDCFKTTVDSANIRLKMAPKNLGCTDPIVAICTVSDEIPNYLMPRHSTMYIYTFMCKFIERDWFLSDIVDYFSFREEFTSSWCLTTTWAAAFSWLSASAN